MQGKFHNQQLLTLLKKLESIAFSGTLYLNLECKEFHGDESDEAYDFKKDVSCVIACRRGQIMYALPHLPDINVIVDFLEHKLHRQWIAPAVVFASRQLKHLKISEER